MPLDYEHICYVLNILQLFQSYLTYVAENNNIYIRRYFNIVGDLNSFYLAHLCFKSFVLRVVLELKLSLDINIVFITQGCFI